MTLIEILFNHVKKSEPEARWEKEGHAFTFPITIPRIGRVWAVVRQEGGLIFVEVGLIEQSELGDYADCISTRLLEETSVSDEGLYYAILPPRVISIKTHLDHYPSGHSHQYIACFNSRYVSIRRSIDKFDGLIKRLLEQCGGD